jgi:large exoprotein involved in heme utilization and adhesion
LATDSFGTGNSGNILIDVEGTARFVGDNPVDGSFGGVSTGIRPGGEGRSGNVEIRARNLEVLDGAQVGTGVFNTGFGDAGNVKLLIEETALFREIDPIGGNPSGVFSNLEPGAQGRGGDIEVRARNLDILNGAFFVAGTFGTGDSGNILVFVEESTRFAGVSSINNRASGVLNSVGPEANGLGGNLQIRTGELDVRDGAQLSFGTLGNGNSGNVLLTVEETARFIGINPNSGTPSGIFTSVRDGGEGRGGEIEIRSRSLEVLDGAGLSAATFGAGDAGSILIEAQDRVTLRGAGGIFTSSEITATGVGNGIRITAPSLQIRNGARLFANTRSAESGGNVVLALGRLSVLDGGRIVAASLGNGAAGSIRVDATEGIEIAGSNPNELSNPVSSLSVRSVSEGPVGNIVIGAAGTTPEVVLDNGGQILADSAAVDGGNITLNLTDLLLLRNVSLISASAGTEQAGGNGGNINISVPFIVAIPEEDSDITADAFEGTGGNVAITARGIFGIEPRAQRTPLSDITASSELGISGNLNLDVLDTDFIENNLTTLDETPVDTATLTAGSCIARTDDTDSSFVVTGADGLPQQPGGDTISVFSTGTVQSPTDAAAATTVQEPQSVYRLADGRLVLSHECE